MKSFSAARFPRAGRTFWNRRRAVIAGGTKVEEAPTGDPLDAVRRLMADGVGKKEALQQIAKVYKLPKRELYNRLVKEGVEDE